MAIIENKVLSQVMALPEQSAFNVQWTNQIIKDDAVIAETFERKAYTEDQKDDFMADVAGAEFYAQAIGWEIPA
jgi:hypothetical protein